MRNAFIDELVELAECDERIVLMVGDLGFGVVEPFSKRFPDRFINAGVAEQNMMGMAAGMASEGMHVFVYSIANFPTYRCAEQIRNDVAYHELAVTVVSVGGGLAYGNLGYSHHAVQDYGLIRSMPNMLIAAPGDPMEVRACVRYLVGAPQPSYLRLAKAGETCLHKKVPNLVPGRWLRIKRGQVGGRTFLTTGATLELATQAATEADAVHSLPLWGMGYKSIQADQVLPFANVATVEDHLLDGGMGSWLMESLVGRPDLLVRIRINALDPSVCGMVGRQSTLNREGGLSLEKLCA